MNVGSVANKVINVGKDVVYGIHPKTNKRFWVFSQTEEFNIAMKEWLGRKA